MDGLIATVLVGLLVGVSVWAKLTFWAAFWGIVTLVLGIFELVAKAKTGKTISQQLWALKKTHPKRFWVVFGIYTFFVLVLIFHWGTIF